MEVDHGNGSEAVALWLVVVVDAVSQVRRLRGGVDQEHRRQWVLMTFGQPLTGLVAGAVSAEAVRGPEPNE